MDSASFLKNNARYNNDRFTTENLSSPNNKSQFLREYSKKPYKTQENLTIKTELEDEYNEKMSTMKQFYQMRLRSFEESINKLYQRLFDDELMKTLKKDSISSDFIYERVKELFQEILSNDKEILLTNITSQYAMLKNELRRVEAEKSELTFEYNKEIANYSNRFEDLNQELMNERKMKENLLEENCEIKSKIDDTQNKLKYELLLKEEEKQKLFENQQFEWQEISKSQHKKEEDLQRLSQINIDMHKNLQFLKNEKEELLKKNKEIENKFKSFEEENLKLKRKNEENDEKINEIKEKLNGKNNEINLLRHEQKLSLDSSFKFEKENNIKYEEFHQMLNIMEEKLESQKKSYKEKKSKLKQKIINYRKQVQNLEKQLGESSGKTKEDLTKIEIERISLLQKNKDLEAMIEDMKRKHMNSINEITLKYEEDLDHNEKKFSNFFEMNIEKLKNDHFQENSYLRSEIERLSKILDDSNYDQNANFIKKAEHFKIITELEALIEDLRKDNEVKEEKFHQDLMMKQKFYEEKFKKDVELIQLATNQKVQFFEDKFKDEAENRRSLQETLTKLEETYKKLLKDRVLLEQELQSQRSQHPIPLYTVEPYDPYKKDISSMKQNEKLQASNEELKTQISSLQEKISKIIKENNILKKKLEEKEQEIQGISEDLSRKSIRTQTLQEEIDGYKNKALNEEKGYKEKINSLKEEIDGLRKDNNMLQNKLNEISKENSEFFDEKRIKISQNKYELTSLEEKLREKEDEIIGKDIKLSKIEKNFKQLQIDFEKKNEENQGLFNSKKDFSQKINNYKRKLQDLKQKIIRNLSRKIEALKRENNEIKGFIKKSLKTIQNDMNIQFNFSATILRTSLKKRELIYEEELDSLKEKLRSEQKVMNSSNKEIELEMNSLKKQIKELNANKRKLENELESTISEISLLKSRNDELLNNINKNSNLNNNDNEESLRELEGKKQEIQRLLIENKALQEKLASSMALSQSKGDKNEENKRLFNELMQLRAAIDTLYTKHKQILEEVTQDIERLKEKQTEEISHINQNYTEMINVMTEKLESFKRDDNNKSTNIVKMSQRIDFLEKINKELENKLNYSAELPNIIENPIKSYESPSLKSGRNVQTIDNSRVLNNKSLGDIEKIYESIEGKDKSDILEQNLNYYGNNQSNNKNLFYSSVSKENDPNNLSYLIMNDEKKIKQFNSYDGSSNYINTNPNYSLKPAQLTQKEVDELKNLLAYTYKNVADNKETTKKFMEEADNLTDKVKELQKMHEFIGNSSFIKKYQSLTALHRSTKSHDSPDFPNYTEKLAQLYSPISVKPSLEREDQILNK